jgi:hypothetical protein
MIQAEVNQDYEMLCVYQNPTSGDIRGFLGKGLKDIQGGDLVSLIAGVNMPMIIWKKGTSYRSKGLAYIYSMMYSEMWSEGEKDLTEIILN